MRDIKTLNPDKKYYFIVDLRIQAAQFTYLPTTHRGERHLGAPRIVTRRSTPGINNTIDTNFNSTSVSFTF